MIRATYAPRPLTVHTARATGFGFTNTLTKHAVSGTPFVPHGFGASTPIHCEASVSNAAINRTMR